MSGIIKSEKITFGNAPSRARRKAKEGDVILSTVRTYLKAIAKIDKKHENHIFSTGFCIISPTRNHFDVSFFSFFIKSDYFIKTVASISAGVSYPSTNVSDIINLLILIPPIGEQIKIRSYLEYQIENHHRLIEKADNAINLLKEKRTALISAAVTRKIDVRESA